MVDLARKNKQVTTFGKLFDPIADKLIVTTVLISLSAFGFIPLWITILFVARDLIVECHQSPYGTKWCWC
nr:CDP-alcohol phosphatidyltransferase family protein [Mycoplasmopsis bovis]